MTQHFDIDTLLDQMAGGLRELLAERGISSAQMIGIYSGGVWVAQQLHRRLALSSPLGYLDITFYRDDFTQDGMHPEVKPSRLPFEVEGSHIVLVDDVLYTGRTIRAALNEIYDYGRPASVLLATLVDRPGRELPIQADVIGARLALGRHEHIKLSGPDPLALTIVETL